MTPHKTLPVHEVINKIPFAIGIVRIKSKNPAFSDHGVDSVIARLANK